MKFEPKNFGTCRKVTEKENDYNDIRDLEYVWNEKSKKERSRKIKDGMRGK